MRKKLKIAVAASPGGHLVQIRQLAEIYEKHDFYYVTFAGGVAEGLREHFFVHTVPDLKRWNPASWIKNCLCCLVVALRNRPGLVISTGAGAVVFFCLWCKLMGAKLIFIESMAKVNKPTWTARILYRVADLFLVQWPNLLKFFPKAKYCGRFF